MEEASYVADYITNGGDKVQDNRAHSFKSMQGHYATSISLFICLNQILLLYVFH